MDAFSWTRSLSEEKAFFLEHIAAKIDNVQVLTCSYCDVKHTAASAGTCSACVNCVGSFTEEEVSLVTSDDFVACFTCFPEFTKAREHYTTALVRIYYFFEESYSTDADRDEEMLSLLHKLYNCLYVSAFTLPAYLKDPLGTFADMLKAKCMRIWEEDGNKILPYTQNTFLLCILPSFYIESYCAYEYENSKVVSEVLNVLEHTRVEVDGMALIPETEFTALMCAEVGYVSVSELPTQSVLKETRRFVEDGMSIQDAYLCALALT